MPDFFRTAVYFKNVPPTERVVRTVAGAALVAVPVAVGAPMWLVAVLAVNGVFAAGTGFVGFCPACYLYGRKLAVRSAEQPEGSGTE
ncbi:MAG: DUF2892 domain-containing protein [Actinomycetota bacterium]|nr:DUF2892 domain-containing protein [Actinomycetota bacterium]